MHDRFADAECLLNHTGMHGEFTVYQNTDYRWLCDGDGVMHSCMSRAHPEQLVLPYQAYMAAWQCFFSPLPPASALLLGLGGGDSIRFLQHHYPDMTIQAVEEDSAIMRMACQWFAVQPEAGKLELVVQEAGNFMARHKSQHDLIIVDMLAGEHMPACLHDDAFWSACYQCLSERGLLLINGIFADSDDFILLMKQLQARFGHLPLCMSVPDHNNVLLVVGRQALTTELALLTSRAELIESATGQEFSEVLRVLVHDNSGIR